MNIPKGYKLVPVEPTKEMLEVLHSNVRIQVDTLDRTADIINDKAWWASVVEAAPTPPQNIYDEAKERELFEAWSANHYYLGGCEVNKEDGEYKDPDMQYSWESWEARVKSVEVGHE